MSSKQVRIRMNTKTGEIENNNGSDEFWNGAAWWDVLISVAKEGKDNIAKVQVYTWNGELVSSADVVIK